MTIRFLPHAAVAALALWSSTASASSPMGVYARVDKVDYEPSKKDATKVVVHGAFALHTAGAAFTYSEPQGGYMYFACPAGSEAECRSQWADIERAIGTQMCAGFGQQQVGFGTVRPAGTPLQSPDTYDLGMGVQNGMSVGGVCPKLLSWTAASPDGGTPNPSGSASSSPAPGATGSNPGSPAANTPPTPAASESSGGCAAAGRDAGTSAWALSAFALATAFFAMRRRARSRAYRSF